MQLSKYFFVTFKHFYWNIFTPFMLFFVLISRQTTPCSILLHNNFNYYMCYFRIPIYNNSTMQYSWHCFLKDILTVKSCTLGNMLEFSKKKKKKNWKWTVIILIYCKNYILELHIIKDNLLLFKFRCKFTEMCCSDCKSEFKQDQCFNDFFQQPLRHQSAKLAGR